MAKEPSPSPGFQPPGWPTVIPRIMTNDVAGVTGFMRSVFDAECTLRGEGPAEVRIGDSLVMVSDGGGMREAKPVFLYVYVADADATYRRAIKAGAVVVEEPVDMPYGDRRAMVRDIWGNLWQMATRRAR